MRASIALFAYSLTGALGCAPSHRMVHDGNVYFERCYGADFDPKITPPLKEACWNAWLAHYTRHQPAHRIDYAMHRVEALMSGEPAPTLPGIGPRAAGAPTPPPASPSTIAELVTLHGPKAGAEASTILSPSAPADRLPMPNGCTTACDGYEKECLARCEGALECRPGCTRERKICLGGCY